MKQKPIRLGLLVSLISIGLIFNIFATSKLPRPINIDDVQNIAIWNKVDWELKSRIATYDEKQKMVAWFNSVTDIRTNKYFAGETPEAGIIIKLKSGKQISIIRSGIDFEVQTNNLLGKRISYWGKQKDIKNLLDEASRNKN